MRRRGGLARNPDRGLRGGGGPSESIVNGRTGILVSDLDEMTTAVDRLLTDATARRSAGPGRRGALAGVHLVPDDRGLGVAARRPRGRPAAGVGHGCRRDGR